MLFQGSPPLCAVRYKVLPPLPGHSVDVDSLHISHADIFIVGEGGRWFSSQMPAHHGGCLLDMTQPSQSALSKQSVHTGKTSTRQESQDISVGYFVLPGYAQDTADASQVECASRAFSPARLRHN